MAAAFGASNFTYIAYSSFRPSYSATLYNHIFQYHRGSKNNCVDIGTGHGVVARALSAHFTHVVGVDPSEGMLEQAKQATPASDYPNVTFAKGTGEALPSLSAETVDLVVAGQAAHWFDWDRAWPELLRVLRRGGTIAFWAYTNPIFPNHARASEVIRRYSYGDAWGAYNPLGPYWTEPGRTIIEQSYRTIVPPEADWEDVTRLEYVPDAKGPRSGKGTILMEQTMRLGDFEEYVRTWSSVHKWYEANPNAKRKRDDAAEGDGDVIDWMLDEIRAGDEHFRDPNNEVLLEWGTGLLMARKK